MGRSAVDREAVGRYKVIERPVSGRQVSDGQ